MREQNSIESARTGKSKRHSRAVNHFVSFGMKVCELPRQTGQMIPKQRDPNNVPVRLPRPKRHPLRPTSVTFLIGGGACVRDTRRRSASTSSTSMLTTQLARARIATG